MSASGHDVSMSDPTTLQATTSNPAPIAASGAGLQTPYGTAGQPPGGPVPADEQPSLGVGTEGEVSVWKGRYSFKNFIIRTIMRTVVTVAWLGVLAYLGDRYHRPGYRGWDLFVWGTGALVALYWLVLGWQILRARLGHLYELTNRRLFVDTGFFRRRRDQIELLKVQDVYVKQQGLFHRLMHIGTVVIESSEERLPVHYLAGVSDPKGLMDLIWHHARKERDLRSVKVDSV